MHYSSQQFTKGFTLLEMLVVIGVIAILTAIVIVALNPVEQFRQARDVTRLSDMRSLKSAVIFYLTDTGATGLGSYMCYSSSPDVSGAGCNGRMNAPGIVTTPLIDAQKTDGSNWTKVNFDLISLDPPFTEVPIDPVNDNEFFYSFAPQF